MGRYCAELICETLGVAMECLDDELAEDWKKNGSRVEWEGTLLG